LVFQHQLTKFTPLAAAIQTGNLLIIKSLIRAGAFKDEPSDGMTPVQWASF
jgi:ankyrin repeat protein